MRFTSLFLQDIKWILRIWLVVYVIRIILAILLFQEKSFSRWNKFFSFLKNGNRILSFLFSFLFIIHPFEWKIEINQLSYFSNKKSSVYKLVPE